MLWANHITANPAVCHGKACVTGTRILVSVILDNLAAGLAPADVIKSYPSMQAEDIAAAMAYEAELARERVVAAPLPLGV